MLNFIKNKKSLAINAGLIIAGIFIGWLFFRGGGNHSSHRTVTTRQDTTAATVWTCAMHPQIRQDKPGKCPICAMDLVPLNTSAGSADGPGKIEISESAMKIADVQTSTVQRAVPGKEIRLPGKVMTDERKIAVITARFGGRVEKLFVNYTGQQVQQGEKLATIYSPELVTAQKELFEAISMKQTNPDYYNAARNKLKLWSLSSSQIDEIEKKGDPQFYFDVLSTLNGTVMKREIALGDYIEEGAKLFEIADLSQVWVLFDAYEQDIPWIKTGQEVNFEVQSVPGKIFTGTVTFIDPIIDQEARVAYVRTETFNTGGRLKPGMFARGIFKTKFPAGENALIIPKSSVLWTGKKAVVYVKDKTKNKPVFEYREIILGEDAGNFYVVNNGLTEGEEIVTNGVFKVDAAAQLAGKRSMMNVVEDEAKEKAEEMHRHENTAKQDAKHFSFKVLGNCEMCEARIEKAAKSVNGVLEADWNKETKIIHISAVDESLKEKVSSAIAIAGHDTEFTRTPEEAYNKLPVCCRFERGK
ncbi:MAG: efflux RND transporter periplasmic adaptor subunit [Bacteroidetes bacterium]|nr:efflux RND transporter periplasmic adaptor subunit [Bacteroidota bacterium]